MKKILFIFALFISSSAFGGECNSDYESSPENTFAHKYKITSLSECLYASKLNPTENFIFKMVENGNLFAISYIQNGKVFSVIPVKK